MNTHNFIANRSRSSGFALIEALVAAVILAAGLIGLALLQVRLTQITGDARDRSVATHLATQQIEQMRNFTQASEYLALNSTAAAPLGNVGGTNFTRAFNVRRYRYNSDPNNDGSSADAAFQLLTAAENTTEMERAAEFKRVQVTVAWTTPDGTVKNVIVDDMISSATPSDGINTAKPSMGPKVGPQIRIFKPTEEGVIPIAIGEDDKGNGIAAASSNPKPKQFADGSTGTTKFTVQTYVQDQTNPLLQRQVDFAYASCACKMTNTTSTTTNPAYSVSYWDGVKYTTPKILTGKPMGERNTAIDQDGLLCDVCCRDHHDKTGEVKVDPFRPATLASVAQYGANGDHNHFQPPDYNTASSNLYAESCKLVRVDGEYRVATDTRLEDLTVLRMNRDANGVPTLPAATVASYAQYAKDYTEDAVAARGVSYPDGGLPSQRSTLAPTYELTSTDTYGSKFMDENRDNKVATTANGKYNLAARGLYIDWLSPEALKKIACIGNTANEDCAPYKNMNLLEFVPFVAINLTDLARWGSSAPTNVSVRNDPVPLDTSKGKPTSGTFIRGEATAINTSPATVSARIFRSNSGLIDTKALDAQDLAEVLADQEEYGATVLPPIKQTYTFLVKITDSTSDANFADQNIRVEFQAPVVQVPICTRGNTQQTSSQHTCSYQDDMDDFVLRLGNYNYKTCSHLGTKWVYDQAGDRCVLPGKNKNDPPQYGAFSVKNFNVCSLSSPTGGLKVTNRQEVNGGTASEYTTFNVGKNGVLNTYAALGGLTNPTFTATFSTTACP